MSFIRSLIMSTLMIPALALAETTTNLVATIPTQEVMNAALEGKVDIVEKALSQGFKPDVRDSQNRTALMYAAFNNQTAIIKALIAAKANVNLQDSIGTSVLMFAASGPGSESIQLLLDAGAQINMVDTNEHFSALMWAAAEGQLDNVKLLLKYNADTTLKDVDGDTAESFAAKAGHTNVVTILHAAAPKTEAKTEQ